MIEVDEKIRTTPDYCDVCDACGSEIHYEEQTIFNYHGEYEEFVPICDCL